MKTQYKQTDYARCPFFSKYGKDSISIKCEGSVGTHVVHVFRNKSDMLYHFDNFCLDCYEGCEHFRTMEAKYEYEKDDR